MLRTPKNGDFVCLFFYKGISERHKNRIAPIFIREIGCAESRHPGRPCGTAACGGKEGLPYLRTDVRPAEFVIRQDGRTGTFRRQQLLVFSF
jgi:hypothetical protein